MPDVVKASKATSKSDTAAGKDHPRPQKASRRESSSGADLLRHTRRGDLLAVTAPLALRKRVAQFHDAESESDDAHEPEETPPLKRLKKATESTTAREQKIKATATKTSKTKAEGSRSGQANGNAARAGSKAEEDQDALDKTLASHGRGAKGSKQNARQGGEGKAPMSQSKETPEQPMKPADSLRPSASFKTPGNAKPPKEMKQSEAGKPIATLDDNEDVTEINDAPGDDAEMSDEEDDQTAALLKGFDSSESDDSSGDEGFKQGQQVPAIPKKDEISRELAKANAEKEPKGSGVMYIGWVSHNALYIVRNG